MLSLRASLAVAALAVLLLLSSQALAAAVGTVTTTTTAMFSDPNDSFDCMAVSGNLMEVFAASGGGDIFHYTKGAAPKTILPAYIAPGAAGTTPLYVSCIADATTGTSLWLLDTRGAALYRWNFKKPTVAPLLIASFPDEQPGAVQAMAIDTTNLVAYVGTRQSDLLYSVNLKQNNTAYAAFNAYSVNSDITAMTLSSTKTTLYYASPAPAEGAPGTINTLAVSKGSVTNSGSPTQLYSSIAMIWPDTLQLNSGNTILYFKDGGGLHGTGNPGNALPQSISQLTLKTKVAKSLYTSSTVNMPTGLGIQTASQLLFTTTTTINSLTLTATAAVSSSAAHKVSSSSTGAHK